MINLLSGDCRTILPTLTAESFDCAIVDPPYGETSLAWDTRVDGWLCDLRRVLKPSASMWVFGSLRFFMEEAAQFSQSGWRLSHEVIWEKHNGTGLFNDRFRRVHEIAAHFYPVSQPWSAIYKQPQFTNDATARVVRKKRRAAQWIGATGDTVYKSEDGGPRLVRSVIYCRSEHGRAIHPTQKPVDLLQLLIAYACPPGGSVIDPFSGSGSTGIAAKATGRNATLIELNQSYVGLQVKRFEGDVPLLAEVAREH